MKIIYNKIIPFGKKYYAINLFGVLFAKGPCNAVMLNHEKIHTAQLKELGFLLFYVLYIMEWLFRIIQFGSFYKGYRNISFEREAYSNEQNLTYLKNRKLYSSYRYYLKEAGMDHKAE